MSRVTSVATTRGAFPLHVTFARASLLLADDGLPSPANRRARSVYVPRFQISTVYFVVSGRTGQSRSPFPPRINSKQVKITTWSRTRCKDVTSVRAVLRFREAAAAEGQFLSMSGGLVHVLLIMTRSTLIHGSCESLQRRS